MNRESHAIAAFSGEIDFSMRDQFRAKLEELNEAEQAIVDLTDVSYMDSIALAEIVRLHQYRTRGGKTPPRVVVGQKISRLFEISGLRLVLSSYASLADAQA